MAEYIDRDRLKSELLILKDKEEPNTQWQDGYISAMDVARMIVVFQPITDVVERSEIDKAIEEINTEYWGGAKFIQETMYHRGLKKALEILKRNIGE